MRPNESRDRSARDVRCKTCGTLLCQIDDSGMTIRRGNLQVTVGGEFHASIVCYWRRCQTLNVINSKGRPGVITKGT